MEYLDKKYDFRKWFDLELYSFDYQFEKSSGKNIDVILKQTGDKPEEIVYVDDDAGALRFAEELGIHTVLYKTGGIKRFFGTLQNLGVQL